MVSLQTKCAKGAPQIGNIQRYLARQRMQVEFLLNLPDSLRGRQACLALDKKISLSSKCGAFLHRFHGGKRYLNTIFLSMNLPIVFKTSTVWLDLLDVLSIKVFWVESLATFEKKETHSNDIFGPKGFFWKSTIL